MKWLDVHSCPVNPDVIHLMKTIRKQIIASTTVDSYGDSIPHEMLRQYFASMPERRPIHNNHDVGRKPLGVLYNKQLIEIDGGHLAICVDMDIEDESVLKNGTGEFNGMSVSYSTETYSVCENRTPDIIVMANPHLFDFKAIKELAHLTNEETAIAVRDIRQKGADQLPLIIFLSFAAGSIFSGFFKEIGKDAYQSLKARINAIRDEKSQSDDRELACHMMFDIVRNGSKTSVLVTASSRDIDYLSEQGLDESHILEEINHCIDCQSATKVVLRAKRNGPLVTLCYYVNTDGEYYAAPKDG